jgi:hypothetical protein
MDETLSQCGRLPRHAAPVAQAQLLRDRQTTKLQKAQRLDQYRQKVAQPGAYEKRLSSMLQQKHAHMHTHQHNENRPCQDQYSNLYTVSELLNRLSNDR